MAAKRLFSVDQKCTPACWSIDKTRKCQRPSTVLRLELGKAYFGFRVTRIVIRQITRNIFFRNSSLLTSCSRGLNKVNIVKSRSKAKPDGTILIPNIKTSSRQRGARATTQTCFCKDRLGFRETNHCYNRLI